jgi:hypothetical protein
MKNSRKFGPSAQTDPMGVPVSMTRNMRARTAISRITRIGLAAMLCFLGGCSLMNPYLRSHLLKCEGATAQDASCAQSSGDFAGGASSAIAAANDQRNLYIREMGRQYWFNSAAGVGIIGLSADAIYEGLTNSKSSLLTKEAAAIAGLYGVDTWLHSKSTESAYIVGFQAITCTLLRTRAILLPSKPDPQEAQDEINFRDYQVAVNAFEAQIKTVDAKLSALQIDWDTGEEAGNTLASGENASLKRETGNVINTLSKSRKLLLTARAYEAEIKTSGPTIRNQVDLIIASVNTQLAQSEPNISALKGVVGTYTDPSKGIAGLQAVTLTPPGGAVTPPVYQPVANSASSPAGKAPTPDQVAAAIVAAGGISSPPNTYAHRVQERVELWAAVSDLYALGRKINAVLDNSQHFYESTKRISACDLGGGAPPLEITPASVTDPVSPGKTLKFTIDGGVGIPGVTLAGSTGAGTDAKTPDLVLSVSGNSLIASVTILPDASGTLTLVASDKGQPPQQAKVTMDVEKSAVATKPAFKASVGDKSIGLSFSTPSAKAGSLDGYTVTLSTGPTNSVTLKFMSPKQGTKATGTSTITGEISSESGTNTTITLGGLTNGQSYTVSLTATFSGASDLIFEDTNNVKPEAAPVSGSKPSVPSIKTAESKANTITITFDAPPNGGSEITGYTATATNVDAEKKKKETPLSGKSQGPQTSVTILKCLTDEEYTVTVIAINKVGRSVASKPSFKVKCDATAAQPAP